MTGAPEHGPDPNPADPVAVARALVRCRSVTPGDDGAQALLGRLLERLGFAVTHLRFGATPNLFARLGTAGPHLCLAGHTDVVPAGEGWRHDPFAGAIEDGVLYGRGACDMKGALGAFVAAAAMLADGVGRHGGSLSLLVTGDEEGPAIDGTRRVLEWMAAHGQTPDFCLVGEPTNPARLGEAIKIGRRGSLNATIAVHGRQGHAAYPERADNPIHALVAALAELAGTALDRGSARFAPSGLQITGLEAGLAANVIPAVARARLNIRFNDLHDAAGLEARLRAVLDRHAPRHELAVACDGGAFATEPGSGPGSPLALLRAAIRAETGLDPALDTGGGTSDARFVARHCPVAEFGLVGASMHQADEGAPVADLHALSRIYARFAGDFLAGRAA